MKVLHPSKPVGSASQTAPSPLLTSPWTPRRRTPLRSFPGWSRPGERGWRRRCAGPGTTTAGSGWVRGRCAEAAPRLSPAPTPSPSPPLREVEEVEGEDLGRVRSFKIQPGSCWRFPCLTRGHGAGADETKCRRPPWGGLGGTPPPPPPLHWSRTRSVLQNQSAVWVKSIMSRSSSRRLGRFLKCAGCCRLGVSSLSVSLNSAPPVVKGWKWPGLSS